MKIFLLDSNGLICRYFFALPEMFTEDGINVNGLFGYCKFIRDLIHKYKNEKISIISAFDRCSKNFRKDICENYKLNRKKSDTNLVVQLNLAEEFCKNINLPVEFHINYEADDIIASIASKSEEKHEVFVVSIDKDFMQIVNEKTKILNPFTKKIYDSNYVKDKFGVAPEDFYLFLALCGDASDNIAGIPGVGPKTALKILEKTKDINEMQSLFPKFDFSQINKMIQLTKFYNNYEFKEIDEYKVDFERFNKSLEKYNFQTIKI
jgi:DNA polymerase-1